MSDERNLIISEIKSANSTLGALKEEEKLLQGQERQLMLMNESDVDLKSILKEVLPPNLVPSNIGDFKDISYPTWYELEFDFTDGANVVFDSSKVPLEDFFQVGNEHGFLLSSISRSYEDSGFVGEGAPLEVTFRNASSSRQFTDEPILIQQLATRGKQTPFTVPMFIHPNSKLLVTMKAWFDASIVSTKGKQKLIFSGRRVDMNSLYTLNNRVF
jgi:hypothetical protein